MPNLKRNVIHLGAVGILGGFLLSSITWITIYKTSDAAAFVMAVPGASLKWIMGDNAPSFFTSNPFYVCVNGCLGALLSMVSLGLFKLMLKDFKE